MAISAGPGGQPEDVFEDILQALLKRLVATQMPEDAPTGNLQLGIWRTPLFLFLGWGGMRVKVSFYAFDIELFFATGRKGGVGEPLL